MRVCANTIVRRGWVYFRLLRQPFILICWNHFALLTVFIRYENATTNNLCKLFFDWS